MANFVATSSCVIYNTVQEAVTALDTALDAVTNTQVIRTCDVIRIEANKYAAILIHTAAV
jgi:hypothetical protein